MRSFLQTVKTVCGDDGNTRLFMTGIMPLRVGNMSHLEEAVNDQGDQPSQEKRKTHRFYDEIFSKIENGQTPAIKVRARTIDIFRSTCQKTAPSRSYRLILLVAVQVRVIPLKRHGF
jgi:hypothetical protein